MEKKYSLYLFDLDGTLLDSDPMLVVTFHYLYKKFKPSNFVIDDNKILTFSGPQIRDTIAKEFPECDQNEVLNAWLEESGKNYPIYTKLYPGALELLKRLVDNGVPTAIITNKHRSATDKAFKVFGLDKIEMYSVCADEAGKLKPNPDGIYNCMEHFGIKNKSQVLYVGDSVFDCLTATNAGVDFALVKWSPRELPIGSKVDLVIDHYDDIREDLK